MTGPLGRLYSDAMNKSRTQFVIATIALTFLGLITAVAVIGDVILGQKSDLTLLLVGALTTATGQAVAYLFRLNGQSGG